MRNYTPQPINRIIGKSETVKKLSEISKVVKIKPLCRLMNVPYTTVSKICGRKQGGITVKTKMMVDVMYEVFQTMKNNAESKRDINSILRREGSYGKK